VSVKIKCFFQIDLSYTTIRDSSIWVRLFCTSGDPSGIGKVLIVLFLNILDVFKSQVLIERLVYCVCCI
jgi:hypothetical protein